VTPPVYPNLSLTGFGYTGGVTWRLENDLAEEKQIKRVGTVM